MSDYCGLLWINNCQKKKNYIVKGRIDIIVGLDQLYGKISNTNTIEHPYKRLALLSTIFGYSLGGSTEEYLDGGSESNMLVSNIEMKTEPTEETNEKDIQQLMERLFTCEMPENSNNNVSADEQYALDTFKDNLKFEEGSYWVKPLFKKNYIPMLNNYNIAL